MHPAATQTSQQTIEKFQKYVIPNYTRYPLSLVHGEGSYVWDAPVKSYQPNAYGLYDMAGNAWEWCNDWYRADAYIRLAIGKVIDNPKGPTESWDPNDPNPNAPKRVMRGGSFLCHVSYCESYRNAARRGNTPDTGMSHVGFRCVVDAGK